MKKILFLIFLNSFLLNAQVNFSIGNTLIDLTHYSSDITSIVSSDLNNNNFKDLIVGSHYDNTIMIYKNVNGDILHNQRIILYTNAQANFNTTYNIKSADIDNDGLNDIIVVSGYEDNLFWFKNLGNYTFSNLNIIATNIDNPKSLVSEDIDNDGDVDLIVGLNNDENVSLFKNNGDGTFSNQQIIYTTNYGVNNVVLKDIDNNGYLDIVSGQEDGSIYWVKNIDGVNFSSSMYITGSADDGTGFDFIDINNDTYLDIVFSSNYEHNLKYLINQSGNSFSSNSIMIDNNITDPYQVKIVDLDNDNLLDILISTFSNDKIGWYKNNNGSFSSLIEVTNNISNPKDIVIEDLDNDGNMEIITSSYSRNNSEMNKLSIFKKNETGNAFSEEIVNFYFGAANAVKVADLNNDGNNDIVSAFRSILWHENLGNNEFSSQKLISSNIETSFVYDIEIKDLNNDNYLDIIAVSDYGLEVYKNNGDASFILEYSLAFSNSSRDVEVVDINNDDNLDILLTFINGDDHLTKLISNGGFDFQAMETIDFSDYGYEPYKIKCGDVDNDGDVDIIVSSKEFSRIQFLENNGSGNFSYNLVAQSISCDPIDLADIDNDGDLDIVTAGSYSYSNQSLSLLKNNGTGSFNSPIVIDYQSCKSLNLGDINNDGKIDIIGTSYEYYPSDEKIFYYLGNGSSFESKVIIESLGDAFSLTKNVGLGDLNNDNKVDIVSSYYFINTVKYFINNSTLSVEDINISNINTFKIFPNPSSKSIHWDKDLNINRILIYDFLGKVLLDESISENNLSINHLKSGNYIIKGISYDKAYTSKLIVK